MIPKSSQNDAKMIPKWSQNHPKTIPRSSQNDLKMIPTWSQHDLNMISKWSQNDHKMIPKRFQIHPKMIPACYKDCPTSYKNDHPITRSHWFKASSRSLQSNFKIFEIKLQRMASLGPSMVVIRDGISPNVCCPYDSWPHSLSTYFETTWTLDWVWREGEMVEPIKNHSTSCARDKA